MGAPVHFTGIESVIEAYSSRRVIAWSINHGKDMLFKYGPGEAEEKLTEEQLIEAGAAELTTALEMIKHSAAIYTLKVFEEPGLKIRSNTPNDGSFNFRLREDNSEKEGRISNNEIMQELNIIKKKLEEKEQQENEEDYYTEEGLGALPGTLAGILGNPAILPVVTSLATAWASKLFPPGVVPPSPIETAAAVNTALQLSTVNRGISGEDSQLINAIAVLKQHDSLIAGHLVKLAKIASEKPLLYQQLVGQLNHIV